MEDKDIRVKVQVQVDEFLREADHKIETFLNDSRSRLDTLINDNHHRLQDVQFSLYEVKNTLAAQDVKLAALYGNGSGKPGAVERLTAKLDGIDTQIKYAIGWIGAASIGLGLLITWYFERGPHK